MSFSLSCAGKLMATPSMPSHEENEMAAKVLSINFCKPPRLFFNTEKHSNADEWPHEINNIINDCFQYMYY